MSRNIEEITKELADIVGEAYVSSHAEECFIYSRDPGTMDPSYPDMVVMPDTTEQVQQIILLANQRELPIVPMGGGLTLSGICRPLKGGIVLDLKRMNRIIEVNESSRYAIVEAGTSQGMLQAYLKKHHPKLKHSIPDSPPIATIGGNVLIHGSGHLSVAGGFHSEMLNGMEVVLPTGEVAKIGSCSVSPYWFSRSPLPDLSGLFLGWMGTTGIVTKLAIKLYPNRPFNDVRIFITEDAELIPSIIQQLTRVQVAEDMLGAVSAKPAWLEGFQMLITRYGAETQKELTLKRDMLNESVREFTNKKIGGFMPIPARMKKNFMEAPQTSVAGFADSRKGGGFEYVGSIMPVELFAGACKKGVEIAERYGFSYALAARIIGAGHSMMFSFSYPFNRADETDVKSAQRALQDTNQVVLEMGGIPWKAEAPAQKEIIQQMDPNTFQLMNRLRNTLDPKGIMNPGNWELH